MALAPGARLKLLLGVRGSGGPQCGMCTVVFLPLYTWCVATGHVHTPAYGFCHMCAQS